MAARCALAGALAAGLLAPQASAAVLTLSLEDLQAPGVQLFDIEARLDVSGSGELRIGRASLPAPLGELTGITLRCASLRLTTRALRCSGGRLGLEAGTLPFADAAVTFEAGFDGRLDLSLSELALAEGEVKLRLHRSATGEITATGELTGLSLAALAPWLPGLPEDVALAGQLQGHGEIRLGARQVSAQASLVLAEVTAASADGRLASEGLSVELRSSVAGRLDGALLVDLAVTRSSGLAYIEPVFLDLDAAPVTLQAAVLVDRGEPLLNRLRLQDGAGVVLEAVGALGLDAQGWLAVTRLEADLPSAYERYLQPFVLGGPFDGLATEGRLQGEGRFAAGRLERLGLQLAELSLRTRDDRLALDDIEASLAWQRTGTPPASWVGWQAGQLFDLDIGQAQLDFVLAGDRLSTREPWRIPLLDGALRLEGVRAEGLTGGTPAFGFDALLEPLSLERLTEALGWPRLGGQLGGTLPGASYRERVIETGGTLEIQVFDGRIDIESLRIEGLLSPLPRLTADVRLSALDLEQLTGTFAFGQISGRLDGEILGLRLLDWRPSAFDAWLATPEDYRGPRRISQRAIDNLTAIGGGGVPGVPGGFLRFFEEFSYDRIGIRCRLRNEVCFMAGVGAANGGYYLVRGRGLPRIDVLGSARQVSWPVLLGQLATLERLEQPEAGR